MGRAETEYGLTAFHVQIRRLHSPHLPIKSCEPYYEYPFSSCTFLSYMVECISYSTDILKV